ncbi:MAG TPA: DNA-3-methyladenine glycosylase [Terriglobales bacterium]|jgi:DNA-3-methyladenine glycosylase II|nr:DNA-3-methyladenine glycosylase [Terriglobales bacterium]
MKHAVRHLKKSDPTLCAIIERVGPFRMQYREPSFEALVRSIVFQQLNGKAARTIYDRLVAAAGGIVTPESMLKLTPAQMRAAGLSKQKLSYIRDLAERTDSGEVDFAALSSLTDEEVIGTLTKVKGIGEWTAHMFLIFALQRPNVLPTGDYGVRAAIKRAYRKRKLPTPAAMEKLAKSWHPYCSVAAWYLWRSMDGEIEI